MSQIAWLQSLDQGRLHRVLLGRPDVLRGAPVRDLADLALRLGQPSGVIEVLQTVPSPAIELLRAAVLFAPTVSADQIAALLEPWEHPEISHRDAVRTVVDQLTERAVLWPVTGSDDQDMRFEIAPVLYLLLEGFSGLGRPVADAAGQISAPELQKVLRRWGVPVPTRKAEVLAQVVTHLSDPARVRQILAPAPARVAQRLLAFAEEQARRAVTIAAGRPAEDERPFDPSDYRERRTALIWAVEHGLAFAPYGMSTMMYGEVEMPSEVVLALAGPIAFPFRPEPPVVARVEVDAERTARTSAAAVSGALSTAMAVLEHLHAHPAPVLRTGGVGSRAITRIAKETGAGPGEVRMALEIGGELDLIEDAGTTVTTADRFDRWRQQPPADRACELLHAWWHLPICPTADRDDDGKALPVLVPSEGSVDGVVRGLALGVVPGGGAPADPAAVVDLVRWAMPLVGPSEAEIRAVRDEAHLWGLLADESVTAIGACLLAGDLLGLRDALRQALPETMSSARIGSDLTAIVAGSPAPDLVDLLDAVAERETRGAASVWRFTPASVRAAFDAGLSAEDLLRRLGSICEGPLPQPLDYLVRDVARRYGEVAVRPTACVIACDSPALAAELVATRSLRRLGLAAVTDTVLAAAVPADEVLSGLRQAGYLPRALDTTGAPVLRLDARLGHPVSTASAPREHPVPTATGALSADPPLSEAGRAVDPDAVVARLFAGTVVQDDETVRALIAEIEPSTRQLDADQRRQLAYAVGHGLPVWIDYRGSSGQVTHRMVSRLELIGPHLHAWCHLQADERMFRIDRLLAVAPAAGFPQD